MQHKAIAHERGNGWPQEGDLVADCDGTMWRVVSAGGWITGSVCHGYVVELADWDDGEAHPSVIEITGETDVEPDMQDEIDHEETL